MPEPEMDLKRELIEAGNHLLNPPSEVDQLLALLDRVEQCLSYVKQQPVVEIQDVLIPTLKVLITYGFLKHPDADVRVGVTACLTEVSRITAPDVPYNDDVMKEVFRLTVTSFEGLSDNFSKLFSKRISILETVARVRSCAVLLDLECNDLVVEMFRIFYKCIRDNHAAIVFASMESIMSLVIEESEEISTDLLLVLLSVLRKDNKDALPIARKLGEKVVRNSATVLKPCILEGIRSLKIHLLDYDFVVTLACQTTQVNNPVTENALSVPKVNGSETVVVIDGDASQKVATASNGNTTNTEVVVLEDDTMDVLNTTNQPDSIVVMHTAEIFQNPAQLGQAAPPSDIAKNPETASPLKSEPKSEKVVKRRGRKPKIAKETTKLTGNIPQPDSNKQSSEVNIHVAPCNTPPVIPSVQFHTLENKSDSNDKKLSSKDVGNYVVALLSPSFSKSFSGKISSKRIIKSKKVMSTNEKKSSHQITEKDTCDGTVDIETRLLCLEKDTPNGVEHVDSELASQVEVKKDQDIEDQSEDTPLKQTNEQLVSPRTKKRGRPRKDVSISPSTGTKDRVSSEGISKKRSRNRSTPAEDGKQHGEELVGLRIKVWWPKDKEFYDGLVESFDSIKKRHQILYTDNERETLNLHKQRWELVESSVGSEKNGEANHTNANDSSDIRVVKMLKMNSDSAGKTGNTGTPPKRRGRPPKRATALDIHVSEDKGIKPEGEVVANKFMIDPMVDAGNPAKSVGSLSNSLPNLNEVVCDSGEEQEVPRNDGKQAKEDFTLSTGIVDTSTRIGETVGIDINEPFSLGNDENPNLDHHKNTTPKYAHLDVNLAEEVMIATSCGSKTEGLSKETSPSASTINSRKRTARTSSNSSSPTVPGSTNTLAKRQRGRSSNLLLESSNKKSEVLGNLLGDSEVDELRSDGCLVVVNSANSPTDERNEANMNSESKASELGLLDNNVTESMNSKINVDVALEQVSSKSTSELKSSFPTGLKLELKTSDTEPMLQMENARKTTSSSSEQPIRYSPVKRPCKPKTGDPKPDSTRDGSSLLTVAVQHNTDLSTRAVEPNTPDDIPNMKPKDYDPAGMVIKESQDFSVPSIADLDLKLGTVTDGRGGDASEKYPVLEASKENMATSYS